MFTPEERAARIDRYTRGVALLRDALAKVPEDARKWKPAPDKWSVHEIVCHCADSEVNASQRIRYVLAEKDPVIVGYDQDEWTRAFDYHALPLDPALRALEVLPVAVLLAACVALTVGAGPVMMHAQATAEGLAHPADYRTAVMAARQRPGPTQKIGGE